MRERLYRVYRHLERIIHPTLKYSQYHYCDTLRRAIQTGCTWLELGCGHQMLASWMTKEEAGLAARASRLVGIDRDFPALKLNPVIHYAIYGDIGSLPFLPRIFDVVTANMVIEHLVDPAVTLREVHRILRPGGIFIFHTPNRRSVMMTIARMMPQSLKNWLARILEGREEHDVFPTHYAMNTTRAIVRHAESAGLAVREIQSVSTNAETALTPFCVVELVYLRILDAFPALAGLRSNLIVILERPGDPSPQMSLRP